MVLEECVEGAAYVAIRVRTQSQGGCGLGLAGCMSRQGPCKGEDKLPLSISKQVLMGCDACRLLVISATNGGSCPKAPWCAANCPARRACDSNMPSIHTPPDVPKHIDTHRHPSATSFCFPACSMRACLPPSSSVANACLDAEPTHAQICIDNLLPVCLCLQNMPAGSLV